MSLNPGTARDGGYQLPLQPSPALQVHGGGPPHHLPHHPQQYSPYHPQQYPPPSPRSTHTNPVGEYANGPIPPHTSSPPLGTGGQSRGPSFDSRSRVGTLLLAAPGYSMDEHKAFREIGDYMSRDGDCMILRRFGTLRFRDLLCKQAQVAAVEQQLEDADRDELVGGGNMNVETVKDLMRELDAKLKAYDDALDRCRRAYTMPRPSHRSLSDVECWLGTRKFQWYIPAGRRGDLINLDQQLVTNGMITRFAALIARRVFKKEVSRKAGVDQIPYHRAVLVSRALISFIAPVILLVPVVLLCYQKRLWVQIIVVAVATITSSIVMMVAKAGGAEVLMATSAYAAVMVVFLGAVANVGNGGGNGPGKGS